ncbi:hypothetical protein Tsubulata_046651 [Turnera subulata]|uniref:Lipoxygenase n=1 Tax=Turnera subulata TaxID=218843 RepID=A0A9Q0J5D2_9ROSI|nr:hypothetical protein Tsubulata_046651 [Turnera subulata]
MLKPKLHSSCSSRPLLSAPIPLILIHASSHIVSFPFPSSRSSSCPKPQRTSGVLVGYNSASSANSSSNGVESTIRQQPTQVKAVVTVKQTVLGFFADLAVGFGDRIGFLGNTLLLELVSAELDPKTGVIKPSIKGYARKIVQEGLQDDVKYEAEFEVPVYFGQVGAIFVENEHHREMYIQDIVLHGLVTGPLQVTCDSWVHCKFHNNQKRVFFTNKSYLPSQTPSGLRGLREQELISLRGNDFGERKKGERVYDYDVYNDLGDPDNDEELARPILGGKDNPYPRRCRTGRPRAKNDPYSEYRGGNWYVPRDEEFSEVKQSTYSAKTVYTGILAVLVPFLSGVLVDPNPDPDPGFPCFATIDSLYNRSINVNDVPPLKDKAFWRRILSNFFKAITDTTEVLRFNAPDTIERDRFFWFRDEEFARQTLSGLNPCGIELVTEWPLKSELDPKVYGAQESAITADVIEEDIKGFRTVEEAVEQKKLFILDYHDLLLPFVGLVRGLRDTTLYGSRTLFFLTPSGTLRPLAIELTRPPLEGKPQWKQVFKPTALDSTGIWLWRIAKAHVLAHESGYHQLISHWLRTHCCTEPYIIAANRQLSAMHPIYRLLRPHFRYTMQINALARQELINAGGIIEFSFSPGRYSLQFSSFIYDKLWRFDHEALPKDLIRRGMAVEDPSATHGLKLAIEDYPYANDGLVLWDAIKDWVSDYVSHYYQSPDSIVSDQELQGWWTEVRTVGHRDKRDEPWWPKLNTPQDLIEIATTIIWMASGHHAAVNFGQYTYAGYFPNRPTAARRNMPTEDPNEEELKLFWEKPEVMLLATFPTKLQATKVMAVLDVLSNHSPDEEYLGEKIESAWAEEPVIKAAFEKFSGRMKELEGIIDQRNADTDLKNRTGAGIVPYELLKPFSEPGVTGRGVPCSITI